MYKHQIWLICLKTNIIDEKFGHYYKPANERIKLWELGFSDKCPLERKKYLFYRLSFKLKIRKGVGVDFPPAVP